MVPQTVFMSNGMITEWYFTSKQGSVVRKRYKNLSIREFYKNLLQAPEFTHAINFIHNIRNKPMSKDLIHDKIEK
jgi:hypothetical protein